MLTKNEVIELARGMVENGVENAQLILEYLEKDRKGADLESGRKGELWNILRESSEGITKEQIMNTMGINKGNLSSLVMYLRKAGIDILKIGDKLILREYVKIGA